MVSSLLERPQGRASRAGVCLLVACAAAASLLAPGALAQQSDADASAALPLSLRGYMLDTRVSQSDRFTAKREARLRFSTGEALAPRSRDARAATREATRGPAGNARFPAWNLPPRTEGLGMFYANVAYGQISDEFDADGDMRPVGDDIPFAASLREAAALVDGLDPAVIPEGVTGTVNVPARLEGEVVSFNLNLGGAVDVYSNDLFSLSLGADFQASQQNFESDRLNVSVAQGRGSIPALGVVDAPLQDIVGAISPGTELPESVEISPDQSEDVPDAVESGFQAQALTLFTQAKTRLFSVRGGFQFDLGQEPNTANFEREVSDRQNAILLGATANYPVSDRFRVYGGVDGWFTLENEEDQVVPVGAGETLELETAYDEGDSYAAQVGADFEVIPNLALGASLTYRYRTEGSADVNSEGFEDLELEAEDSGYHLGISPYVNYMPENLPLTLYLKGGVRDEYRDFSFSLIGENEFAPRAGATLGAVYRF